MKRTSSSIVLIFLCLILLSCTNEVSRVEIINLHTHDNIIEWNENDEALCYDVYVEEEFYVTTYKTFVDFSSLGNGTYNIKVKAISGKTNKKDSLFYNTSITIVEIVKSDTFSVFMINDTHGAFFDGIYPGIARISSLIDTLDEDIIKIINGDAFQGTYESNQVYGRCLIDAFNQMEFDAFVIGNHEFDWGLDKIKQYSDGIEENGEANFPFLGANIIDKSSGEIVDFLKPYTIVEKNGLRVGIIGLIGYNLESSILYSNVEEYEFVYPVNIVKNLSKELRTNELCDSVIVSIHDYDTELNNTLLSFIGDYSIDAILCGHTHQLITETINNKPIVENKSQNQTAISIDFDLSDDSFVINTYYPLDYEESDLFKPLLSSYSYLKEEAETVIGYAYNNIYKSTLGSIGVKQMNNEFDSVVSIINKAGIRDIIRKGDIKINDIFLMNPFNNEIITLNMKGKDIKSLINSNSDYLYYDLKIDFDKLDNETFYKVSVIDYCFYSTYYSEFRKYDYINTKIILRDLIINYFKNQ